MGGADAVGAGVATTNDQHILAAGGDALGLWELDAGEDAVLLRQEFEGEMHPFQITSWDIEIACLRGTGGHHYGIERLLLKGNGGGLYAVAELDAFLF